MFNRAGYQRIFIEAVRRRGEAIHIREIRGGGVSRDELSFADLWGVDYNPGELVYVFGLSVRRELATGSGYRGWVAMA